MYAPEDCAEISTLLCEGRENLPLAGHLWSSPQLVQGFAGKRHLLSKHMEPWQRILGSTHQDFFDFIQSCLAMRSSAAGGVQGLALPLAESLETAR